MNPVLSLILGVLGVFVDLRMLIPTTAYHTFIGQTKMIVDGDWIYATEAGGRYTSMRTINKTPITFSFHPPVYQIDWVAHANAGDECDIPTAVFCGITSGLFLCQSEHTLRLDEDGCAYAYGQWGFGTPPTGKWRVMFIKAFNLELWKLSVQP